MKQESQKQREQRVGYQKAMGMMHDRFVGEPECPKCEEMPCVCDQEKEEELRQSKEMLCLIRGGM